jgi:hypothetical protein
LKAHIHTGRPFVRPASFTDVSCVRICDDAGRVLAIAIDFEGMTAVSVAGDREFETLMRKYGFDPGPKAQAIELGGE